MQNILHRKRTWRQDSIGEIYLEELLGLGIGNLSVLSLWDMVFLTVRKVVVFVGDASNNGWGEIYESGRKVFYLGHENILYVLRVMVFWWENYQFPESLVMHFFSSEKNDVGEC